MPCFPFRRENRGGVSMVSAQGTMRSSHSVSWTLVVDALGTEQRMRAHEIGKPPIVGGLDNRLIANMRLVLSSALLFLINPIAVNDIDAFQIVAALYIVYAAVIYISIRQRVPSLLVRSAFWIDILWSTLLLAFADDSSSAFLFLFPVMVAAFQLGFVPTMRLIFIVALLLTLNGFLKTRFNQDLALLEILMPSLYVIIFGYLVAAWGEREIAGRRRLVLLKEITVISNPRFGIDHTVNSFLKRLRRFYNAEMCLLIVSDTNNTYQLRRVDRDGSEWVTTKGSTPPETTQMLLALPSDETMLYHGKTGMWRWLQSARYYTFDDQGGWRVESSSSTNEVLITVLDASSIISVPVTDPYRVTGRLYLTATRRCAFSFSDATFLRQVIDQMIPVIESIRLVDQLASSAAEEERHRLAHDIHDNVVQPYIGFQIGLGAIIQKARVSPNDIVDDLTKLMEVTDQGIVALRHYMHWLSGNGKRETVLLAAVWRFIATFTKTAQIAVQVEAASDLSINDRLATEVFQMIVEGLNNIRRHTNAQSASIGLARQDDWFILRISNDGADVMESTPFMPRSIAARAVALGGRVKVEQSSEGITQVIVEIPL